MKPLNKNTAAKPELPVKILQFGEGNFLRAFVDWLVHKANEAGVMNHGVAVVQPIETGMTDALNRQDCLYHVILEGINNGKPVREVTPVKSIVCAVNPYKDYEAYKEIFLSDDLEMTVSNTTEAGIRYEEGDDLKALPPKTYPAKMTALLYQRFLKFHGAADKGLIIICCELIENNGSTLREYVLKHAEYNRLGDDFIRWIKTACHFYDTLVDRIVPGFPRENIDEIKAELGFDDNLVVKGEYFHVWAIGGDDVIREKLPLDKAGLNVLFMNDIRPFRAKKVRILNGSHTAMTPVALQLGCQTVKEAFDNPQVERYIRQMVETEILPAIDEDPEELKHFAAKILERFYNPYIRHYLKDISLNSLSKWETRNFPTLRDNVLRLRRPAPLTTYSFASLLALYSGKSKTDFTPNDIPEFVDFIQKTYNSGNIRSWVDGIIHHKTMWNVNFDEIPGFAESVAEDIKLIMK